MSERVDQMEITDDIDSLCDDLDSFMDMSDLDDLPTAIIVTNVPASVFTDADSQVWIGIFCIALKEIMRIEEKFINSRGIHFL